SAKPQAATGITMRCPVCRAENGDESSCRRCRADLSLLAGLEARRRCELAAAQNALLAQDAPEALDHAAAAHYLRHGNDSAQLVQVYYPAPAVVSQPFVTYYAPPPVYVAPAPTVTYYQPVTTAYYQPVTTAYYQPVTTTVYAAPAPVVYSPGVVTTRSFVGL